VGRGGWRCACGTAAGGEGAARLRARGGSRRLARSVEAGGSREAGARRGGQRLAEAGARQRMEVHGGRWRRQRSGALHAGGGGSFAAALWCSPGDAVAAARVQRWPRVRSSGVMSASGRRAQRRWRSAAR
jgi:hypothetical protein